MENLYSYPKVYNLGHGAIQDIFKDPVLIEEKLDGSQFSFGVFNGVLRCKSKNQELNIDSPVSMFEKAVETAKRLQPLLTDGWTYRTEYLQKKKHNVIMYDRVPKQYIALYDVNTGQEKYLSHLKKFSEAEKLNLEIVPFFGFMQINDVDSLSRLLDRDSFLGGAKIEGIVIKNYSRFAKDGKALLGKWVSEVFKERHNKEWKKVNKSTTDIITEISNYFKTDASWQKSIQHLRDEGKLENSPTDIGSLIKEVQQDIKAENEDEIKSLLFTYAWPHIKRQIVKGLPEWYKQKLLDKVFDNLKTTEREIKWK